MSRECPVGPQKGGGGGYDRRTERDTISSIPPRPNFREMNRMLIE